MSKTNFREEITEIIKSGTVEQADILGTWCEVSEITFAELEELNKKFKIESLEGFDSDNVTIFFEMKA